MPRPCVLLTVIAALLLGPAVLAENENPAADPIPTLQTRGYVYKTEGPNDTRIYDTTIGKKKAIMVFVDFPDRPMKTETKERANAALGGDMFQRIFKEQSYGKLTIDVKLVHGWRRMPEDAKNYSSKTTRSHREMFEAVFALFPEINFLEYDYIISNMPNMGNTAFGAHGRQAINHRGKKITVALNLASQNPYVLAHETGHLMGLPDLYTYGDLQPKNPAGPWDIMSQAQRAAGFIGWHRHKFGWLDADRKTYLTEGTHKLTLTPLSADTGVSMIVVPTGDADKPSKVFVVEVAQTPRLGNRDTRKPEGVLVYHVDANLPTGRNPVVVYPKEDIILVPYQAGDTFEHDDAPMSVKVIRKNEDGSYEVEVVVK